MALVLINGMVVKYDIIQYEMSYRSYLSYIR